MLVKTAVLKIPRKTYSVVFLLKNSTCPISYLQPYWKLNKPYMFPVIVPRILEIGRWAPVVETRFSKAARETSAICNFAEICNTCVVMFWKVTLLKISISLLLTRVAGFQKLQCYCCYLYRCWCRDTDAETSKWPKNYWKQKKKSKKNTVEKKKAKYEPQWKFVIGQEPTQFYWSKLTM